MKIEELRPSFTIYTVASQTGRLEGLADSLSLAGYMVATFTELTAAFSEIYSNPPHFLLFDGQESKFDVSDAIAQVKVQLPESHVFVVAPTTEREKVAPLLDAGVYDLILTPLASHVELVRALDRAAERDYFMYLNENLTQVNAKIETPAPLPEVPKEPAKTTPPPAPAPRAQVAAHHSGDDFHLNYARRLFAKRSADECIDIFLKTVSQSLNGCGAVFFKFIANRRVLAATLHHHLKDVDITGVGLNFNESNPNFRTAQLREPNQVPEIAAMVQEVFGKETFFAVPVEALGELQGIALFLANRPDGENGGALADWSMLLDRALSLIEAEKRLHVVSVKDPATGLWNRANFQNRVRDEVSRARRTNLPASMLLIAVDQYGVMVSQAGQEEAQTLLKMVARVFEKHSRVNDVLGRTGADEFAILLPHTGKHGAQIKAERLRRIIESADFSRVLSTFPRITISLGVAEYPRMVRDADELFQLADEALFQVRETGNKTCIAKSPDGFVADFEVREKDN